MKQQDPIPEKTQANRRVAHRERASACCPKCKNTLDAFYAIRRNDPVSVECPRCGYFRVFHHTASTLSDYYSFDHAEELAAASAAARAKRPGRHAKNAQKHKYPDIA